MKSLHDFISVQNEWVQFLCPRSTSRHNLYLSELSCWKIWKRYKMFFQSTHSPSFLNFAQTDPAQADDRGEWKWAFAHRRHQLSELITPVAKSITFELWVSTFSFDEESSLKDLLQHTLLCFNMEIKRLQSSCHLRWAVTYEKVQWAERLLPLKPHRWIICYHKLRFYIYSTFAPNTSLNSQPKLLCFPALKDTNNILLRTIKRVLFIWAFCC